MKNKARLFGIYLPVYIAVLCVSVVLRTVALFIDFQIDTGYFNSKTIITIADYFVVLTSMFLFTYIFTARKDIKLIPSFTSPATYVPTAVLFVSIIFMLRAIADEYKAAKQLIEYYKVINTDDSAQIIYSQKILLVLLAISFVFAICTVVHLLMTGLIESHSSTKRAYFGLCTTIFFAIYAAYIYFNTALPLNAPNKVLDQIAYLFFASFFLFEARLSIGREKWRGYIAFGFISSLLAAYSSIPSMIYYFATKAAVANNIYETALTFAVFIFITARVLLTGELVEDKPSETVNTLIAFAEDRNKKVRNVPELRDIVEIEGEELEAFTPTEDNENQITIDDMGIEPIALEASDITDEEEEKEKTLEEE